jgi:hypothetical protein
VTFSSGGTSNLVVRLEDAFVLPFVPHLIYEVNGTIVVSKVELKSWHVLVAKLQMWLTNDQANVIPNVVFLHNEEGIFQLKGALVHWH